MSSMANPVFPAYSNVAPQILSTPMPLPKPISVSYVPKGFAAPIAHHCKPCYGGFNEVGIILVLFILLVIISRFWIV